MKHTVKGYDGTYEVIYETAMIPNATTAYLLAFWSDGTDTNTGYSRLGILGWEVSQCLRRDLSDRTDRCAENVEQEQPRPICFKPVGPGEFYCVMSPVGAGWVGTFTDEQECASEQEAIEYGLREVKARELRDQERKRAARKADDAKQVARTAVGPSTPQ